MEEITITAKEVKPDDLLRSQSRLCNVSGALGPPSWDWIVEEARQNIFNQQMAIRVKQIHYPNYIEFRLPLEQEIDVRRET